MLQLPITLGKSFFYGASFGAVVLAFFHFFSWHTVGEKFSPAETAILEMLFFIVYGGIGSVVFALSLKYLGKVNSSKTGNTLAALILGLGYPFAMNTITKPFFEVLPLWLYHLSLLVIIPLLLALLFLLITYFGYTWGQTNSPKSRQELL